MTYLDNSSDRALFEELKSIQPQPMDEEQKSQVAPTVIKVAQTIAQLLGNDNSEVTPFLPYIHHIKEIDKHLQLSTQNKELKDALEAIANYTEPYTKMSFMEASNELQGRPPKTCLIYQDKHSGKIEMAYVSNMPGEESGAFETWSHTLCDKTANRETVGLALTSFINEQALFGRKELILKPKRNSPISAEAYSHGNIDAEEKIYRLKDSMPGNYLISENSENLELILVQMQDPHQKKVSLKKLENGNYQYGMNQTYSSLDEFIKFYNSKFASKFLQPILPPLENSHGKMDAQEAATRLSGQESGTYLVRESKGETSGFLIDYVSEDKKINQMFLKPFHGRYELQVGPWEIHSFNSFDEFLQEFKTELKRSVRPFLEPSTSLPISASQAQKMLSQKAVGTYLIHHSPQDPKVCFVSYVDATTGIQTKEFDSAKISLEFIQNNARLFKEKLILSRDEAAQTNNNSNITEVFNPQIENDLKLTRLKKLIQEKGGSQALMQFLDNYTIGFGNITKTVYVDTSKDQREAITDWVNQLHDFGFEILDPKSLLELIKTFIPVSKQVEYRKNFLAVLCNQIGHEWSLRTELKVGEGSIKTEGSYSEFSKAYMASSIRDFFQESTPTSSILTKEEKSDLAEMIQRATRYANDSSAAEALKDYRAGKMVSISTGWYKHTVEVIVYKDYLVYINRGEKDESKHNMRIFKIDKQKVNEEWFKKIMVNPQKKAESERGKQMDFFDRGGMINELGLIEIGTVMKTDQKVGNCSFANAKGGFQAGIILTLLEKRNFTPLSNTVLADPKDPKAKEEYDLMGPSPNVEIWKKSLDDALKVYKEWDYFNHLKGLETVLGLEQYSRDKESIIPPSSYYLAIVDIAQKINKRTKYLTDPHFADTAISIFVENMRREIQQYLENSKLNLNDCIIEGKMDPESYLWNSPKGSFILGKSRRDQSLILFYSTGNHNTERLAIPKEIETLGELLRNQKRLGVELTYPA